MKKNPIINIGILGTASIAKRSVIPAIVSLPRLFNLSGIASRDFSKSKSIALPYKCKSYGSYETLLADPTIDAVYIPLPNSLHYPFVLSALENKKHVFVEKSLGCNLFEVEEMVALASKNKLALLENFQFRFHSQLKAIKDLIEKKYIGELRSIRTSFGFPPFPDKSNIRYDANLGGGALLDAGAYMFKLGTLLLGDEVKISHASMVYNQRKDIDIWGGGALQQLNGPLFCHFSYGFDHYYQCSLDLWGSIGKISTNRIFTAPSDFSPSLSIETAKGKETLVLPTDDHFKKMLEYFYKLISNKKLVLKENKQSLLQARLIDEFKENAKR